MSGTLTEAPTGTGLTAFRPLRAFAMYWTFSPLRLVSGRMFLAFTVENGSKILPSHRVFPRNQPVLEALPEMLNTASTPIFTSGLVTLK